MGVSKAVKGALRILSAGLAASILTSVAFAQAVYDSPFGGKSKAETAPAPSKPIPSQLDELEFTGVFAVEGYVTISLYDTKEKRSVWVPLESSEEGYSITDFNEEKGSITVSFGGLSRELAINENEIVTLKQPVPRAGAQRKDKAIAQKDPETLRKEEEARSFVSDLLAGSLAKREENRRAREELINRARNGSERQR